MGFINPLKGGAQVRPFFYSLLGPCASHIAHSQPKCTPTWLKHTRMSTQLKRTLTPTQPKITRTSSPTFSGREGSEVLCDFSNT